MEINPSNESLTQLRDQWQKILIIVLLKQGIREIDITEADIVAINANGKFPFCVVHGRQDGFKLVLRDSERDALEYVTKNQRKG